MRIARKILFAVLAALVVGIGWFRWQMTEWLETNVLDEQFQRQFIGAESNLEVSYFEAGDPDLGRIIYSHGSPGNSSAWEEYLKAPVKGMHSITYDRPGFGQTTPKDPEPSLAVQAQAIAPFLEPTGGQKPILVGHSLGGPVIVQAALDYPDKVGGIIVVAGSVDPAEEEMRWFNYAAKIPIINSIIPFALWASNEEIWPLEGELEKMAERLYDLHVPVVIVHATDDSLVPYANVTFMEEMFPAEMMYDVIILEERDHFLPWNSEAEVRQAIEMLAKKLRESASNN